VTVSLAIAMAMAMAMVAASALKIKPIAAVAAAEGRVIGCGAPCGEQRGTYRSFASCSANSKE